MAYKLLLFFMLCCCVRCWTNYRISLRSVQLLHIDNEYLKLNEYVVKKFNRTYTALPINFTVLRPLDDFNETIQLYQEVSNRYKEFLPTMKISYCAMISGSSKRKEENIGAKVFNKLKQNIVEMLCSGNKFPCSCPISAANYFVKIHVNEETLPAFLLPTGKYKLFVSITYYERVLMESFTAFEIKTYSSEKQRNQASR